MKIFESIDSFTSTKKTVVTIGSFDGVHLGHQKIIASLKAESQKLDAESLILSFLNHPRSVLNNNSDLKLLTTNHEKTALLRKSNLNHLILHPFDNDFANLSAQEFVSEILVKKLNVAKIIVGHDHRFGKNRSAGFDDLKLFGQQYGFKVQQISAQEIDEVSISSTKIRNALVDGNIKLANDFLGYAYSIAGNVVAGKQLGRTIGVPTANIAIDNLQKMMPKKGVYVVQSFLDNKTVFGVMNIGNRPTVDGQEQTVEIHFLDFDKDLYHQKISVSILDRIRDEQKFESLADLKIQISKDIEVARKLVF
ncbi:MAG: Riboflavin biosynthesis protein RibF [Bacteroidota bacterium]